MIKIYYLVFLNWDIRWLPNHEFQIEQSLDKTIILLDGLNTMCVKCLNVCFLRLFIEDKVLLYLFLQIGIKSIYTLKVFHFLTISFAQGIMVKQISYPNELDRDDEIIHLNKGRNTFLSNKDIKSRYNQNSNL